MSEAPRGTLFHHYTVDAHGLIQRVNLIIATGHNNLAMNRTIAQIARHFVHGDRIGEGALNRVEAGIRAYDSVSQLFDACRRNDAADAHTGRR